MCLIHHRNILTALLLASLCFPLLPGRAQEQAPVAQSQHGRLDPAVKEEYRKWINEDVRWIITDDERADFKRLLSDKQRDEFVVAFWDRRNPSPGAARNVFKEEHYQRLAYANTNFAGGVAGWRTDRGRFYITYGPPNKVDFHPKGGAIGDPPDQGDFDFEVWHYSYIEGLGHDVTLEFVDTCSCGEYHLMRDPFDKTHPKERE